MIIALWIGYLLLSFVMTSMLAQLFPDERFRIEGIVAAILFATIGAYVGDVFFDETFLTGALVGAGIASAAILTLFHLSDFLTTGKRE